ncbi:MAG TPA: hypothetical protein VGL39_27590 [Jatrophihabitantaceae bacterium]|jgi:hypothetical protein
MPKGGTDEGACDQPPRYAARLTWSCQPEIHLCEDHAAVERAHGDVIEIRSLPREQAAR